MPLKRAVVVVQLSGLDPRRWHGEHWWRGGRQKLATKASATAPPDAKTRPKRPRGQPRVAA